MKKKNKYTDGPLSIEESLDDILKNPEFVDDRSIPSPTELKNLKRKGIALHNIVSDEEDKKRGLVPSADELVAMQKKEKTTIMLNSKSIKFLKNFASENNISYQVMIRDIIDSAVANMQLKHTS
jgi:predicted DNA binding CopG/RHH family protein